MSNSDLSPHNGVEYRQSGLLATVFIVTILSSATVAMRLAVRTWIVRSVGWDDYTIILATFGIIIGCGLVVVEIHYGFGKHKTNLTQWQYIEFMKYSYGEWIQTFQTLMFNKLSICFFLLRIPVEKHLIRPIQAMIIGLIVSNIVLTFLWIFQCNPIARAWNTQTPGTCFTDGQLQRIIISQALISIISDFVLALFPVLLLWKVRIDIRTKFGLCILMGLGLITAACCMVRTVLNWQNVNSDPTWKSVDNWYWRSWEVCIGVIAACIPALRPGYKTVSAGIASYFSQRSFGQTSDGALVKSGKHLEIPKDQRRNAHASHEKGHPARQNPDSPSSFNTPFGAAAQAASAKADDAEAYGAGEDGFAMNNLPGDTKTVKRGIQEMTNDNVGESQQSLVLGDIEQGHGGFKKRDFV